MLKKLSFFYLVFFLFVACSEDEVVQPVLVDSQNVLNLSPSDIQTAYSALGLEEFNPDVQYRAKVYEITFKSDYNGTPVEASALVAVPDVEGSFPILSFNHGTIADHASAPTRNQRNQIPLLGIATTGYIVVLPDYLGFGASEEVLHPYYIAEAMGESGYHAVQATKDLINELGRSHDGKLFLSGYSEGGYAAMATHKYIEENTSMAVTASAPASGGYDVKGFQEYLFALDTYAQPFFLAYVAQAYYEYYGFSADINSFFQEPYASSLDQLFDGTNSGTYINDQLTENIGDLLQPDALQNFDSDAQFAPFRDALIDNTLTSWSPNSVVYMYHGTADVTVPFQNSVDSYEQLLEIPGNENTIEFIEISGGTHASGVLPYVKDMYAKFKDLK